MIELENMYVGMPVRVVSEVTGDDWGDGMEDFLGMETEIVGIRDGDDVYYGGALLKGCDSWIWHSWMLEPVFDDAADAVIGTPDLSTLSDMLDFSVRPNGAPVPKK